MDSLHYNGSSSFVFVNTVETCQFKAKDSEIKPYPLCLGKISKNFAINNMKKTRLKEYVNAISLDCNIIDTNNIFDICKYLMKIT